jgi:hypothetical protein
MVEFSIAEEHVRVRVSRHRKGALANAGADERPGFALTMRRSPSTSSRIGADWRPSSPMPSERSRPVTSTL